MDDITGVSNLVDLEKLFSDPFNTLMLKFPSEMIPKARFTCDSSSAFAYEVRETFMELMDMVQRLISGELTSDSFECAGNVGAGKSHNLAAAVVYLRKVFKLQESCLRIVYILNCEQVMGVTSVVILKKILFETFREDLADLTVTEFRDQLSRVDDWSQLKKLLSALPERSLIYIIDDYNFLLPEAKQLAELQRVKMELQGNLKECTTYQYFIYAISSASENLAASKNTSETLARLGLFGGLSDDEYECWMRRWMCTPDPKPVGRAGGFHIRGAEGGGAASDTEGSVSPAMNGNKSLTAGQILSIRDITGRVPLHLWQLLSLPGSIEEKMELYINHFNYGGQIQMEIEMFATRILERPANLKSYSSFIADVILHSRSRYLPDLGLINNRYIFRKGDVPIHYPVSGFVRMALLDIQFRKILEMFLSNFTVDWIRTAMRIKDPIAKAASFETYCLASLARNLLERVQVTNCQVLTFRERPLKEDLGKEVSENQLFWPSSRLYPRVDRVLRVCSTGKMGRKTIAHDEIKCINLYGIQVAMQAPENHSRSELFFSDTGRWADFLLEDKEEILQQTLVWIILFGTKCKELATEVQVPCPTADNKGRTVSVKQILVFMKTDR